MTNKKKIEMAAVAKFLKLKGINTEESDFDLNPSEPSDVIYLPTNEKFQVTQAAGEIGKLLNKKFVSFGHNAEEIFETFVRIPVQRKTVLYGGGSAVNDITLIIYDLIESSFLEKDIAEKLNDPKIIDFLKKSGFKEIYCVFNFPEKNRSLKIFP